jgi:hypothetical protein
MDDDEAHHQAIAAEYEQQVEDDYRHEMAITAHLEDLEADEYERARRER